MKFAAVNWANTWPAAHRSRGDYPSVDLAPLNWSSTRVSWLARSFPLSIPLGTTNETLGQKPSSRPQANQACMQQQTVRLSPSIQACSHLKLSSCEPDWPWTRSSSSSANGAPKRWAQRPCSQPSTAFRRKLFVISGRWSRGQPKPSLIGASLKRPDPAAHVHCWLHATARLRDRRLTQKLVREINWTKASVLQRYTLAICQNKNKVLRTWIHNNPIKRFKEIAQDSWTHGLRRARNLNSCFWVDASNSGS